ncbi:hypothetical protein P152DRAFT_461207 [Eremomyces bilateralis CBS 781.70]|uniref:Uncharacterized protein n=1 Tax=Eremomyces bilateralis CBS 781.70 TaxID=1392243 RepID=A0A6G1FVT3_9PEZI|nr:uncharacterized protein P152DRAFT_461207 [Eremomyces bilateralis CBS 781.70]KAF1809816.1 hypothetical protein P152DRAFT_461207 [Eremomyces bilateralis CBS 781.70]
MEVESDSPPTEQDEQREIENETPQTRTTGEQLFEEIVEDTAAEELAKINTDRLNPSQKRSRDEEQEPMIVGGYSMRRTVGQRGAKVQRLAALRRIRRKEKQRKPSENEPK